MIGIDPTTLRDLADIRNSLAHEYAMDFAEVAPILNRAWHSINTLIAVVASIETFVRDSVTLGKAR